jgi:hypothetical protein
MGEKMQFYSQFPAILRFTSVLGLSYLLDKNTTDSSLQQGLNP